MADLEVIIVRAGVKENGETLAFSMHEVLGPRPVLSSAAKNVTYRKFKLEGVPLEEYLTGLGGGWREIGRRDTGNGTVFDVVYARGGASPLEAGVLSNG